MQFLIYFSLEFRFVIVEKKSFVDETDSLFPLNFFIVIFDYVKVETNIDGGT